MNKNKITIEEFMEFVRGRTGKLKNLFKEYYQKSGYKQNDALVRQITKALKNNFKLVNKGFDVYFIDTNIYYFSSDCHFEQINIPEKMVKVKKAVEQVIIPVKKEEPQLPDINTDVVNTQKIKQQVISILDNTIGAYADSLEYVRAYLQDATKKQKVDKEERQVFRDVIDGMNSITKASSNVIDMITKVE